MSVTTRTQRVTNPGLAFSTNTYAAVAGTGGTNILNYNVGPGGMQRDAFGRISWSVATTAVSGGGTLTQTGLSASTTYAMQVWLRPSKTQTMRLVASFRNSSNTVINTVTGSGMQITANDYSPVQVTGTSGAGVDRVVLTYEATTGGSNWASGDTLDIGGAMIMTGTTYFDYFDGETPSGGGMTFAWSGTPDASNSIATVYTPVLALVAKTDAPCPRVEITISDLDPTENVVSIWRTVDGKQKAVRGAREWTVIGSDAVVDYEVPLGRVTQYDLEISSGITAGVTVPSGAITVTDTKGWIQDPLDPTSAVPVYPDIGPNGEPSFTSEAFKQFEYAAKSSLIPIIGEDEPVALIAQRMVANNVPFDMFTDQAQQATTLRNILAEAAPVLVRPLPEWARALPGLCYVSVATVREMPVNEGWGGEIVEWGLQGDLVASPTMNIVVVVTSYGDVQALWTTYQQAQTTLAGKKYLDVKKNPATG